VAVVLPSLGIAENQGWQYNCHPNKWACWKCEENHNMPT
jgi:hypothetical protein